MIGQTLAHYRITAALGAGGMGEVWRAEDEKLGREVALKVLPQDFAKDPERMARFEREAKVLASLNHPNIATLYGLETVLNSGTDAGADADAGTTTFLAMELVEGENLAERITRGSVPVDEAIAIALQIAEALEAAHERGIVHRDLKPANIKVTEDGTVKVLDFGLAKAWEANGSDSGLSMSPTLTAHATAAGVILGTAAYMSPEQARGKKVDRRADIWAFGVVLWEMLTGHKLFEGETVSDVMAAVLTKDLEVEELPPQVPIGVRRVLRRCLERDPRNRLRDIGDAALELRETSQGEISDPMPPQSSLALAGRVGRRLTMVAVAVAICTTALALWALTRRDPNTRAMTTSVSYELKTFDQQAIFNARFLPDGRGIVYSGAASGNVSDLFVLPAGAQAPRKLASAGVSLLSVSDSGELAVLTDTSFINHRVLVGTLARMSVDGSPRPLVEGVRDADWGADGSLAIVRRVGGSDRLEYPIGTVLYETSGYVSEPRVSADGQTVAFLDHQWWQDDRGWVKAVDRSGQVTTLSEEFWAIEGLAWASDGRTLFFSGALGTPDLQPRATTLNGNVSTPVLAAPGSFTVLDVAGDGDWLGIAEENKLGVAVGRPGGVSDIDLTWLDSCWGPALSPDGQTVLFSNGRGGPNYSVVTRRLDGSPVTTLGEGDADGFSPDGRWVAAVIATPPGVALYPTGTGSPRLLERGRIEQYQGVQWFPDGTSVLVSGNEPSRPVRDYRQSIDGGQPEPVTPERIDGRLRPDGSAVIALDSDGVWKIYPLDGGTPTPVAGIRRDEIVAAWNPEGSAVFVYRQGDVPAHIDRLDLSTGQRSPALTIAPEQRAGLVRIWLEAQVFDPSHGYAYGYEQRLSRLYVVRGAGG